MALEAKVVSTELIKPSSPTPQHLQKYQLSFLDQIAPQVFVPLIMYYPPDERKDEREDIRPEDRSTPISNHLKKSLSDTLTRYYPLAGRVIDNSYVDCNDEGARFVEARVDRQLTDIIRNPVINELNKLLPFELDNVTDLTLAIQVNYFKCGGIAVAVIISHKVADGLSCFNFINTWAAVARGDHEIPSPIFESATLFPPLDVTGFQARIGVVNENIVCKRFVFSADKIAALRDRYAASHNTDTDTDTNEFSYRPTRVEALSVFIWNRYKAATQKPKGELDNKIYTILHPVNLRKKFDPPLPDNYFGNLYQVAITVAAAKEDEKLGGFDLVKKMRETIRSIDMAYVEKVRKGENEHLRYMMEMCDKFNKGEVVSFSFTSLCRFGLYEADFGWGKPVWMSSTRLTFEYLVTFFDTKNGEGIEAWINLKEEEMGKFEVDKELLEFIEDPSAKCANDDDQLLK